MFDTNQDDSGVYFSLVVSSNTAEKLYNFCKNIINLDMESANCLFSNKMHASILASKFKNNSEEHYQKFVDPELKISVKPKKWKILPSQNTNKKCLSIVIDSPDLEELHESLKLKTGLTHAFPDFLTHISVHYDFKGSEEDLKELPLPDFSIELEKMFSKPYYFKPKIKSFIDIRNQKINDWDSEIIINRKMEKELIQKFNSVEKKSMYLNS